MAERQSLNWRNQPADIRTARAALSERIKLTRAAVGAERFARAFWPLWTLVFVFATFLMFDVVGLFSAFWARIAVAGFVLAALFLAGLALRKFRWPRLIDAENRIDDSLPGRPLAAMSDTMVLGKDDPAALRVWSAHLRRMAEAALRAKTAVPDLRLARHDPWAIRLAGVLAIAAAALFARGDGVASLENALLPGPETLVVLSGPTFEAWANPPAYTGKPPLYLTELLGRGPLLVPVGTGIAIRVYGEPEGVVLVEDVSGAATGLSLSATAIQDAALVVTKDGSVTLEGPDGQLGTWTFTTIADAPPTIRLTEPVSRAVSGAMELRYAASDDYGVVEAWAEISIDQPAVQRRYGLIVDPIAREPLIATLPLPVTGGTGEIAETLVEDFSKHAWAGLPVTITLHARDAADQVAKIDEAIPALPSRRFFDPLAAAIMEQRRDLLWSPENGLRVERVFKSVTWHPQDIFVDNSAYLLARTAIRRLGYAREDGLSGPEIDDLAEMLWVIALKIEEGDLSDAAERLRRAQERLSEALENGATDQEMAQLMDELREAMQEYMQQMAREMMANGPQQQAENQQTMTQDQLQQMLDEIQRLAENGQTEEAQALLEQLQRMLENMQMTMQQGQGQPGAQGRGEQTLQELQDMLRQQQDLADDAFRELQEQFQQGRNGQPGRQGEQGQKGQQPGQGPQDGQQGQSPGEGEMQGQGRSPGELADRQEALRQLLEELRQGLPGASGDAGEAARQALRDAERNMGDARDNLKGDELGDALDRQADALESLRESMRDLAEEMQQQAQSQGRQPGQGMENSESTNESRDPLGRPTGTNGSIFSDEQLLPGDEALQRARQLLDEIRRRAGQQDRPKIELEYLRRLLERF